MARPGCGIELTTRTDQAELPPVGLVAVMLPPKPVELLTAEAELDTWRIVEVFSRTGLPFEVDLSWSSGSGSGAHALVTVSRSARICVLARSLKVLASNLANLTNRVGVTVADAYAATENQWEVTDLAAVQGVEQELPLPPFARKVRVELADPTGLPATVLRLYDGQDSLRSTVMGDLQPPEGIPLGGARRLTLAAGAPTAWRAVFTLCL